MTQIDSALITLYRAQETGREPRPVRLNKRAELVRERVEGMCEWRLGRDSLLSEDMRQSGPRPEPIALDVMFACLKRIRKSIQRWDKKGGRQGYLTFIGRF